MTDFIRNGQAAKCGGNTRTCALYDRKAVSEKIGIFMLIAVTIVVMVLHCFVTYAGEEENTYVYDNGTTKVTFSVPSEVNLKTGEKVPFEMTCTDPSVLCSIAWQYPSGGKLENIGFGSYWDQKAACTIVGKDAASSNMILTVEILSGKEKPQTLDKFTLKTKVNITASEDYVALESISLNKSSLELTVGESAKLFVSSYNPANATFDPKESWCSSHSDIVSVNNGVIKALKPGTAVINVSVGRRTTSCRVTVKNPEVKSLSLNKTTMTVDLCGTETLTATYSPDSTVVKNAITWESSDRSVATVSNGVVKGVREGTAIISAKVGDKTAACTVTVKYNELTAIPLQSIEIYRSAKSVKVGDRLTMMVLYIPSNVTVSPDVIWTSSDTSIATVNNGIVTGIKAGTVTITAQAWGKTATSTIVVNDNHDANIPLTSITLNKSTVSLEVGDRSYLSVLYNPTNTTANKAVTWTSSDSSVAVLSNGYVVGKKAGTATITAKVGGKTAKCTVTVRNKTVALSSIALNKSSMTLDTGSSSSLTVSYNPTNTTANKAVTWTSSNTSVATVSSNGVVKGVKVGTATITAKVGGKTAKCTVTVKETPPVVALKSISLNKYSLALKVGESSNLAVIYNPSNTTVDKTVYWRSSDTSVATVSNGKVTGIKPGTVTISAQVGYMVKQCKVTVSTGELISIKLSQSTMETTVNWGWQLYVIYNPSNATVNKTVTWTSSNPSVATVKDGMVMGKSAGTAVITAKVGRMTAKCTVTVKGSEGCFLDVSAAYTELNKFRTQKGVWQWNSDNKSKTCFNTNSSNTLKGLTRNAELEKYAQIRAKELVTLFSHTRPDGTSSLSGFPVSSSYKGENVAAGYFTTASSVTTAWMESSNNYSGQGHRRNMLNKQFNAVGIACYYYNGTYFWVQVYAKI